MPTSPSALPPLLLPRPRSIEMTGGQAPLLLKAMVANEHLDLPIEGEDAYVLRIDKRGATITARSEAGTAFGERTLMQLRRQYGETGPAMTIQDAPAFRTRGVMLDISRDRVPTMKQLRETVDLLAQLKFNHLQLYTEHTFAYKGHEEAWRGWSPMTPDEIRELDEYCSLRGIELAANQNCFGHLSRWLELPKYAPLAETHGEWVFENEHERFHRHGPFSLCPTDPKSLAFVGDLLNQLLPCFESPLVNIGCDETFDVGWGRSKADVERRGRAAVYFDFVNQIADIARELGKRPMFWADIALSHPEAIEQIPEDMVCLAWGYEPDSPFADWCSRLRDAGREVWVCPGTSSWRSITGRTAERNANLRAAATQGLAHGATGYLVTDWGDSGHHQQWPITLAAIAEAAECAWSGAGTPFDDRAASLHAFNDESLSIVHWLDDLGNVDAGLRALSGRRAPSEQPTRLRNSSFLFNDLFLPLGPGGDDRLRAGALGVPGSKVSEVVRSLQNLRPPPPLARQPAEEVRHSLAVATFAAERAHFRRFGMRSEESHALRQSLQHIMTEHRRLWLARCREGGLADSLSYYDKVLKELA